jgi:hypothetical protein
VSGGREATTLPTNVWRNVMEFNGLRLALNPVLLSGLPVSAVAEDGKVVTLDHGSGTMSPNGPIDLRNGELFKIELKNTYPDCFDYNQVAVREESPDRVEALKQALGPPEIVTWAVSHRSSIAAYQISAVRRACAGVSGLPPEREWTISVNTHGWDLGMSGAFTIDTVTDPVFFLEKTKKDGEDGFNVRQRDSSAENDVNLSTALQMHLFDTKPRTLTLVPVSFGIAVSDTFSTAKYLVGAGIAFEKKLFATAGVMFSQVARLPNAVGVGDFTTDANALSDLPKRTDTGFFFSVSLNVTTVGGIFSQPFEKAIPKPDE